MERYSDKILKNKGIQGFCQHQINLFANDLPTKKLFLSIKK